MGRGGIFGQLPGEAGAEVDEDGPRLRHAQVKVRERGDEIRLLVPVPENAGFVVPEAVVFRQGACVPGPELREGHVHEAAPCRRALPDDIEILGAEKDGA